MQVGMQALVFSYLIGLLFINDRRNITPTFTLNFHHEHHVQYFEFHSDNDFRSGYMELGFLSAGQPKNQICLEASYGDLIVYYVIL